MTTLNAGLVIPRGTAPDVVAGIVQAEARGVRTAWSTAGGATADTLINFAGAAVQTSAITLGTSIVPTYPRHPVALAGEVIALEGLAPGRLRLGVGPSHKPMIEGQFGIPMGKPLDHLREYITILRALLWEGKVDFQGEYLKASTTLPDSVIPPNTPLLISALRENAYRLAGEVADGAISWVAPVKYLVETALSALDTAAKAANRQRPPLIAHVPVAVSTDRAAAREAFRSQFPIYAKLPFYQKMFEAAGYPVTAQQTMTDDLVDNLAISGTDDDIRTRLEAIHAEGIDELLISHVPVTDAGRELASLSAILAG